MTHRPEAKRRAVGSGLLISAALLLAAGCGEKPAPNLVLVTIDTTRADHLGSYGYRVGTSPAIDALAGSGARFDFAIAQSATTPVSCASLLTGAYPFRHGLRAMHGHEMNRLRGDVPTLPEKLRGLGYQTAAFVSAYPAGSVYGLARGFDLFDEGFLAERKATVTAEGIVRTGRSQRTAAETNREVLAWLRHRAAEPFFLWVHYFDPHDMNLVPPRRLVAEFLRATAEEDRDEFRRSVYDGEIHFADAHVAQLVATLEDLGWSDRTVMAITADHGEGLGDHDWWTHGILYQEQIRVPLVLAGPGIPRARVVDEMVELVDLFPTLLDLADPDRLADPRATDGASLLPLLRGDGGAAGKRFAYSETHNIFSLGGRPEQRNRSEIYSLIRGRLKLIHYPRDPAFDQLYDLAADPREESNLIASRRSEAGELLRQLESLKAVGGHVPDSSTLAPEVYERLKSLGYVE